jgi:cell division protein FtsX
MLTGSKPAARSLGVWGGAVAAAAGALGLIGYAVTPEQAAELGQQTDALVAAAVELVTLFAGVASTVGGILAVVGRIRATRRIGPDPESR